MRCSVRTTTPKLTEKKPTSVGDFAHPHLDQLNTQKSNAAKMGSLVLRIEIAVRIRSLRGYFKDMSPLVRFHAEAFFIGASETDP